MRRLKRTLAAAATATLPIVLSACGAGESEPPTVTMTTWVPHPDDEVSAAPEDSESSITTAAKAEPHPTAVFADILDNSQSYLSGLGDFDADGTYSYAILEATGDDVPDMVLRVNSPEFSRVYLATATGDGKAQLSTAYILDGAASAGGSRSWVYGDNAGRGLWETTGQSVQQNHTSKLYVLDGTNLVTTGDQLTSYVGSVSDGQFEIDWHDSTDRSGLKAPAAPAAESKAAPAESGYAGTVLALSTQEAAAVTGGHTNGEPADYIYYVFKFDSPTEITGRRFSGPDAKETRTVEYVSLGEKSKLRDDSARWEPLVGQHGTLSFDESESYWPSGTDMPIGMMHLAGVQSLQFTS